MKQVLVSEEMLRQVIDSLEATCGHRCNAEYNPCNEQELVWQLRNALEQPAEEPTPWVPVANGLPVPGVVVLACYRNGLGNLRRIRAEWVAAKTQEADGSEEVECAEYDEATDTFYIAQGWYERIDNWGDYSSVAVTEGEVTHWMPLPPAPDAAPQAQQPRIGTVTSVEQTLEQWEHDFKNPMTPEQQTDWVKREREFAARQAQQPAGEINQCDGCRSGQEMRGPLHVDRDGKATMVCQAYKYQQPRKAVKLTDTQPPCNTHPDAPHGFDRNRSHLLGRYVCDCEGWMP